MHQPPQFRNVSGLIPSWSAIRRSAALLGFDLTNYSDLCRQWRGRSDRYRATKAAKGFGATGRQPQRAYHDALRDLAVSAMGHPPLVRAAATDGDGAQAYATVRARLLGL